mgnify:CR=1 FL=1
MIFYNEQNAFESEKERNFYYKIFAGYIFNEFISGYENRINMFVDTLQKTRYKGPNAQEITSLDINSVRVSFDNHIYLLESDSTDRGEFADILIQDATNKILIPIEAKFYDDWTYEKDIIENSTRHKVLMKLLPDAKIIPLLIITEKKWKECIDHQNHKASNYKKLIDNKRNNFRVLCWEDLRPLVADNARLLNYINGRLNITNKNKMRVNIKDNWFFR